ncbi:hypothetical protein L9F63_020402 [Diploptera punctata]|uniref:Uncharacterized protein n=1 Tax=Diploptera punctata TaxID=6984 RepID=A0AAD7ZSS0_DIPPU|nr:hypothetical protein L9F63_020402 [Diploptera punctata]
MASDKVSVVLQPLDGHEFISILRSFRRMLSSCIGPRAGIKIVITPAGYITYTSSSSRLLNSIILENPICVYINQIIKSQMKTYQDCGLYCGIFITTLLENVLTKEMDLPFPAVIKIIEYLTSEMESVFNLNSMKMKVDFSTIKQLLPLVQSILSSKPLCGLTEPQIENLQFNIVKGFVQTIGSPIGRLVVECTDGSEMESKVFPGLLYQIKHEDLVNLNDKCTKEGITILLFNIMLTDVEDDIKISDNRDVKIEKNTKKNYFLEESLSLFEEVVNMNVDIVACQKVVDPALCFYLERRGILVLERLGTDLTVLLEKLSQATSISTVNFNCLRDKLAGFFGRIDIIKQIQFGKRHYLLLEKKSGNMATLICNAPNEEAATELKVVIKQCISALNSLILYPEVTPGAGCFEMSFSIRLMIQVLNKFDNSICTRSQIESCISWFQKALVYSAGMCNESSSHFTVDSVYGHVWKFNKENCCCGLISHDMVKKQGNVEWVQFFNNEGTFFLQNLKLFSKLSSDSLALKEHAIVDLYKSKENAIKLCVETCVSLLGIGMVVYKPHKS